MDSWGMCQPHRKFCGTVDFFGFGASELISSGILSGSLDAAVLACDGAGNRDRNNTGDGAGNRREDPRTREHQASCRGDGPDRARATIDPVLGMAKACEKGFGCVAVTVASAGTAHEIREKFPESFIFGVHLSVSSKRTLKRWSGSQIL